MNEESVYSNIDDFYITVETGSQNPLIRRMTESSVEANCYEEPRTAEKKREIERRNVLSRSLLINQAGFQRNSRERQPIYENVKKEANASPNFGIMFSHIKTGFLILFTLLTALFVVLFVQQNLKASNLQDTINDQVEIMNRQVGDILQLKDKIMELSSDHTSVMLLGGTNGSLTDSMIIYNSAEKSWNDCQIKLPNILAGHGAVILNDEIYIFGGYSEYDPLTSLYKLGEDGHWIKLADMSERRSNIRRSYVIFDSEIWAIGGWSGFIWLKTVEKYNPQTNSWTKMPELNEGRLAASATVVNGKIYVSGGCDGRIIPSMEVYDPAKEKWEIFAELPEGLSDHSSLGQQNSLLITGGKKPDYSFSNEFWKIDILDAKKQWRKLPGMQHKRRHHGFVELEDGLIVFGGNLNDTTHINSVEIFDGGRWKNGANLPEVRGEFGLIPLTRKQEKYFIQQFCKI